MSAGILKGWVPVEYLDEVSPPPRAAPDDWLVRGDVLRLASPDTETDNEPGFVVGAGETVHFASLTEFGTIRVDYQGGKSFRALDPVPDGATLFCIPCDPDTVSKSLEQLFSSLIDEEPGEFTIACYDWSHTAFTLRNGTFVAEVSSSSPAKAAAFDLHAFSAENRARCEDPTGFNHPLESWSLSDWMTATLGELGEAANVIKKLNRVRDGIPGNDKTPVQLRQDLADELADGFIYLDLMAQAAGIDLPAAVRAKFDRTSRKIGFVSA